MSQQEPQEMSQEQLVGFIEAHMLYAIVGIQELFKKQNTEQTPLVIGGLAHQMLAKKLENLNVIQEPQNGTK